MLQCPDVDVELIVTGFSQDLDKKAVKSKLHQLSSNTGGKVVRITKKCAFLQFKTNTLAKRYVDVFVHFFLKLKHFKYIALLLICRTI